MDSDLAKVRPLIPANPHLITGNFEEKENSKEAETTRESPRQPTRAWSGGRGGEISPMKTVQPGFLAMGAGSGRRRRRDRGKEAALTPRRTRSPDVGRQAKRATGATGRAGDEASAREEVGSGERLFGSV